MTVAGGEQRTVDGNRQEERRSRDEQLAVDVAAPAPRRSGRVDAGLGRRLQVGYVPTEVAPELGGDEQAMSLWEFRGDDGERIGLRLLIVPADAWIQEPRA